MNNELYHYGVKGMKWGQRRAEAKMNKLSLRSKKKGWSDDATEAAKIKTKKVGQMSNSELRKLNERQQLELNYKRSNPNAIKKGLLILGATVATMETISKLRKHGGSLVSGGKQVTDKITRKYFSKLN